MDSPWSDSCLAAAFLRMEAATFGETLQTGEIEIRPDEFTALAAGKPLPLTPR